MHCILVELMEWTIADTAITATTFKLNILVDSCCMWINGWLTRVCCDRLAAYYRFDTTPVTLIVVTLGTLYYGNKQAQFIKARALPWWTVEAGGQLSGVRPIEGLPAGGMRQVLHSSCNISAQLCTITLLSCCVSFTLTHSFSRALNMSDMVLQLCQVCT